MKIRFIITIACILLSSKTFAEPYQWEAGFFTSNQEDDTNFEVDTTIISITHYFNPVSTSNGPLAEAEFLGRASNAYFALVTSFDLSDPTGSVDGDGLILGGMYYVPETDFFIGLSLLRATIDFTPSEDVDDTIITVGAYLDKKSQISLEIASGETFGFDTSGISLGYKRLMNVGEKDLNVEFGVANVKIDSVPSETNTNVSLSGDIYFNRQFSIGAGFNSNSGDDLSQEGTTISFGARYFVTPAVSFELALDEFSVDDTASGEDASTLSFEVLGRF